MNGFASWLFNAYGEPLKALANDLTGNLLSAVAATVQGCIIIYVLIIGKKMLSNAIAFDEVATRVIRALIVLMLLTPAHFNDYITKNANETIPNAIASAVGGQGNTVPTTWDQLTVQVDQYGAKVRAQAPGPLYIGERIVIWLAMAMADVIIAACVLITFLASGTIAYINPLGAILIPMYLFDSLRGFCMQWVGKLISLFFVLLLSLMLGAFIVKQNEAYMTQFGNMIAANNANPNFSTNGGTLAFSGIMGLEGPAIGGAPSAADTANVDAAIDTLWHIVAVFAVGLFLLSIMVAIALFIGMSSGFTAAPVFSFISGAAAVALNAGRRR